MLDRLVDKLLGLPPAEGPKPVVTRDLTVPMPDGVTLHSFPKPYSATDLSNFVAKLIGKG